MIKAFIFDVDGVLFDTVPYHFEAWKKMFSEEGVHITFTDYLEKLNGLPRDTGIKNVLSSVSPKLLNTLAQRKQEYFLSAVKEHPPQPLAGVIDFIRHLQAMNINVAAASSSKNAPYLIRNSLLNDYLKTIVSGNDFSRPKPDPEIFITAATRLQIEPINCAVVEDATVGIKAAKTADMKTIGLLRSKDNAIAQEADFIVYSLEEYKKILQYINSH